MALSSSYVQSLPTCSSDVTQLPALSTVLVDQHRVSRWLLMPPATMSLSVVPAACFASPIAWSVFCHISSGSCYTQPDFGYCAGGYQHGCNHVRFHHGQQRALWYLWHPGQRPQNTRAHVIHFYGGSQGRTPCAAALVVAYICHGVWCACHYPSRRSAML